MRLMIIDWLGRGGIAQCAAAYAQTGVQAGHEVTVVTRAERELAKGSVGRVIAVKAPPGGPIVWHLAVVTAAVKAVRGSEVEALIVHDSLIPAIEAPLYEACRRRGIPVVLVAHNHQPHERYSPSRFGREWLINRSERVVVHSEFVASRMPRTVADPLVLPLPSFLELATRSPRPRVEPRRALQFGNVGRGYKGASVLAELAQAGVSDWQLRLVGAGSDALATAGLSTRDGWIGLDDLVDEVGASSAVVLPYRAATQSGAVRLTQQLGRVVIATAVGGIPEQIVDGVDGVLIPDGVPSTVRGVLEDLTSDRIDSISHAALARGRADDEAFAAGFGGFLSGDAPR